MWDWIATVFLILSIQVHEARRERWRGLWALLNGEGSLISLYVCLIVFGWITIDTQHFHSSNPDLGDKPSLFLGNIPDMIAAGGFTEEFFYQMHAKYGPMTGFHLAPGALNVSVADPDMAAGRMVWLFDILEVVFCFTNTLNRSLQKVPNPAS